MRLKRHGDDFQGCDDGEHGIEIDLQDESNWKCKEGKWQIDEDAHEHLPECYNNQRAYHVCIDKTIENLYTSDIPHSGPHREVWAKYGEYNYLPPGRYVHNLEHGAVVFMYHPCAPTKMVDKLRRVATTCLYRYIMTSFGNLTHEYPYAVVTYGCIYRMSVVNSSLIKEWIRSMNGNSPEPDVYGNGEYIYGLLSPSIEPAERNDSFCMDGPGDDVPLPFSGSDVMSHPLSTSMPDDIFDTTQPDEKSVTTVNIPTMNEGDLLKPGTSETITKNVSRFDTHDIYASDGVDSLWLLSAVVFLVFGIFTCLCLIKLWTAPKGTSESTLRIWSDNNGDDSYSVAAIVRKLPSALKSEKKQLYHPVHIDDQSTEDEEI